MVRFAEIVGAEAAWLDLCARGVIRVSGADRVRFLNGMLTIDVEALGSGGAAYALMLDAKGRLRADLWLATLEGEILIDPVEGTREAVASTLERHVVADDVVVEDLGDAWSGITVEGPGARAACSAAGVEVPDPGRVRVTSIDDDRVVALGCGQLTAEGIRLLGPARRVGDLASLLGVPRMSAAAVEALRVASFLPRFGVDVDDRTLPEEARLLHAVSTTKGCYVGQEIVARLRTRGQVRRLLVLIRPDRPVERGASISVGGSPVGEVTSAAELPGGSLALGYVKREHARPGTKVDVSGAPGIVVGPPSEGGEDSGATRT